MNRPRRVLLVPAAGLGSRLRSELPKPLVLVDGRPMIDVVLDLYASLVERFVLVLNPAHETAVRTHLAGARLDIEFAVQSRPTGMLDAILAPIEIIRRDPPEHVWMTWCDQVAVRLETLETMAALSSANPSAAIVLPTIRRTLPYIHLVRDAGQTIVEVLQRREGDTMPDEGETEIGVFSLSAAAYLDLLPLFARETTPGLTTGERNFLPFIPWVARRALVQTFPAIDELESVGVNTPDELRRIDAHLRSRRGEHGQTVTREG